VNPPPDNQTQQQPSNQGAVNDSYPADGTLLYVFLFIFAIIGIVVVIRNIIRMYKEHRKK